MTEAVKHKQNALLLALITYYIPDMLQLWRFQRNGHQRVGHNKQTDLSRFWVKGQGK